MNTIAYKEDRTYTVHDLEDLFLSVDWMSGKYPDRLKKAMDYCETVYTAWDGNQLVGLVNAIDDGEMTAYVHYLCVNPKYQGCGIGRELLNKIKDKYQKYLYIIVIAENDELIKYYSRNGFEHITGRHVFVVQNDSL